MMMTKTIKTITVVAACALAIGLSSSAFAGYWYTDFDVSGIGSVPADIYDTGSWLEATLHFPDGSTHHADGYRNSLGHIQWTWRD